MDGDVRGSDTGRSRPTLVPGGNVSGQLYALGVSAGGLGSLPLRPWATLSVEPIDFGLSGCAEDFGPTPFCRAEETVWEVSLGLSVGR